MSMSKTKFSLSIDEILLKKIRYLIIEENITISSYIERLIKNDIIKKENEKNGKNI
jgi:hypothetical protein